MLATLSYRLNRAVLEWLVLFVIHIHRRTTVKNAWGLIGKSTSLSVVNFCLKKFWRIPTRFKVHSFPVLSIQHTCCPLATFQKEKKTKQEEHIQSPLLWGGKFRSWQELEYVLRFILTCRSFEDCEMISEIIAARTKAPDSLSLID